MFLAQPQNGLTGMYEIVAAVLGGFLAAITGYIIERYREKSRLKQLKALLCIGIEDDLRNSVELYDKLLEDYEKTQVVWYATINELKESRQIYQNSKDWITLFPDDALRKRIFRYYHRSTDLLSGLQFSEQRKYELNEKIRDLARSILEKDPTMSEQDADVVARQYLSDDVKKLAWTESSIPKDLAKLKEYRQDATTLLASIEREQAKLK
jgi:hypothetical protein